MPDFMRLRDAVLNGDLTAAVAAARAALAEGAPAIHLMEQAISPAMAEVGQRFEAGDYFVPELLMAARATKGVFDIIRPLLSQGQTNRRGRVVLGTVQGDLHDIGKNLVAAMLESGGLEVIDLGVNVPPEKFVAAVEEHKPDLLGLSALLTTTMPAMKTTLDALRARGLRGRVKVMIGGAPTTQAFSDSIGADGYGESAASAPDVARRLISA